MPDWLAPLHPYGATALYLHANRRLYERHGLSLTPAEYLQLCRDISRDLPSLKQFPSGAPGRVRLRYAITGRLVPLVFDLQERLIVTVLGGDGPPPRYEEPPVRKPPKKPKMGRSKRPRSGWTRYDG